MQRFWKPEVRVEGAAWLGMVRECQCGFSDLHVKRLYIVALEKLEQSTHWQQLHERTVIDEEPVQAIE